MGRKVHPRVLELGLTVHPRVWELGWKVHPRVWELDARVVGCHVRSILYVFHDVHDQHCTGIGNEGQGDIASLGSTSDK